MAKEQHAYLKTHKLSGALLTPDLAGDAATLTDRAAQSRSGRAAKTLVKEGQLRVTLVALHRGGSLAAHHVEGVVSVHALRGRCVLDAGGRSVIVGQGQLVVMGEGVEHSLCAQTDCMLLVTVAMAC